MNNAVSSLLAAFLFNLLIHFSVVQIGRHLLLISMTHAICSLS